MPKQVYWAKDGAEPAPWSDRLVYPGLPLLLVLLIALRVAGVTAWSWWLVLVPLWVMMALFAGSYWAARDHHRHSLR